MSKLNPIALSLNEKLEEAAPEVLAMLSEYGRRLYFPKGIISQTAEAKERAHRFNATIGIATEGGGPLALPSIERQLGEMPVADALTYAPPAGRARRAAPRCESAGGRNCGRRTLRSRKSGSVSPS